MTRIDLKDKDIGIIAFGEPTHWYVNIFDRNNSRESSEQLKKQMLDDYESCDFFGSINFEILKEKAEKWDDLQEGIKQMKSTGRGGVQIGVKFAKLMNENEKNKEIVQKVREYYEENKWQLAQDRTNDDGTTGEWDEMGHLEKLKEILGDGK